MTFIDGARVTKRRNGAERGVVNVQVKLIL